MERKKTTDNMADLFGNKTIRCHRACNRERKRLKLEIFFCSNLQPALSGE